MSKKPKKSDIHRQTATSNIQRTKVKIPEGISFSFRYYRPDNEKFSIRGTDARYLEALLLRWRYLSTLTRQEVINNRSKSLRCHVIDWKDTTEPKGFGLANEDELVGVPYQLQISANEHGRIHGFFSENIFYIVWLDPDHNLYS